MTRGQPTVSPTLHCPGQRSVHLRVQRLITVIADAGIGGGDVVAVACCDHHRSDAEVASEAARRCGAEVAALGCDAPPEAFLASNRAQRPALTFACEEGVRAWVAARCVGRILGDGAGVPWWELAERRAVPAPTCGAPGCAGLRRDSN
jgi:hypothetical protein